MSTAVVESAEQAQKKLEEKKAKEVADAKREAFLWKIALVVAALVMIVLSVVLLAWIAGTETVSTVTTNADAGTVETKAEGAAPPAALVTTTIGCAVALMIFAAFYSRIKTIELPGGTKVGLDAAAAIADKVEDEVKKNNVPAADAPAVARTALEIADYRGYINLALEPMDVADLSVNAAKRRLNFS